jgi:hypothetical protein
VPGVTPDDCVAGLRVCEPVRVIAISTEGRPSLTENLPESRLEAAGLHSSLWPMWTMFPGPSNLAALRAKQDCDKFTFRVPAPVASDRNPGPLAGGFSGVTVNMQFFSSP